jgi:glutaryl-CoA dehydrogenase
MNAPHSASAARFEWDDPLLLEAQLSDEERMVREAARAYAQEQLAPRVTAAFRAESTDPAIFREMGALGLLGATLPEVYGGAGLNAVSYGLIAREIERVDSGYRSMMSVQSSLVMLPIFEFGTEEQRRRWLPPLARGEAIGCFGLTEADHGSDPAGMRTVARRDGSDWVLDGSKMWITNAPVADVATIWAQTDEGIRGFLVPTVTPGFAAHEVPRKMSLRASITGEIVLDGVRLPADAAFPEVRGLKGPLSCLNEARFGIVWGAVGAARDCLETAIAYATAREQFDRPIAGFQLTQQKLADMALEVAKGYLLAVRLGRLKDDGLARPEMVSAAKLNNVREAIEVARTARTILGGSGITLDYPVIRHSMNLESVLTYEGTSEIHTLVVGKALTGLDAFR